MAERWREYFDSHGAFNPDWLKTAVAHWGFHEVLYGMIQRYSGPSSRLLDVGCGPGWSDMYLSSMGYQVVGVDNEPTLVELANQQAQRLGVNAEFVVGDAFDLSTLEGKFDLAFSCGVLEHFDRDVTVQLLKEQAKCSKYVLIEIPTKHTAYAGGITDERIYTINELADIVRDAGLEVVSKFGYGDLAATRVQAAMRRFLPRAVLRFLQNRGYAYAIAVIGKSR